MLKNKVAVITGGAKGIGRYIAHGFAREGAKLAIGDIDLERLKQTEAELREIGADPLTLKLDVRVEDEVRAFMKETVGRFGRLDVLVNNAGIVTHFGWGVPRWPLVRDMEKNFWDKVMETNLGGTFLCTKHALPHMQRQRSGHIINLYGGSPPKTLGSCVYSVSKDAIRTFTRFVAEEVRDSNICVVSVSPGGAIATEDAPEEIRRTMPGPESAGNRFVLAAQAGMELSGQRLTLKDGVLQADPRG
ncbi:MAG TPA: SDR family NAD(P)-dependent oxidoreductase [Verrucomicrobiae bacterium]|jgi:3-oxoacyl-[acyl-carrier protein] reductase|nr:SDR family NAD(P)-dependent oxidoreductase [Verrucomicrobiae bacterium]